VVSPFVDIDNSNGLRVQSIHTQKDGLKGSEEKNRTHKLFVFREIGISFTAQFDFNYTVPERSESSRQHAEPELGMGYISVF
jgi:hypothetical protein